MNHTIQKAAVSSHNNSKLDRNLERGADHTCFLSYLSNKICVIVKLVFSRDIMHIHSLSQASWANNDCNQ